MAAPASETALSCDPNATRPTPGARRVVRDTDRPAVRAVQQTGEGNTDVESMKTPMTIEGAEALRAELKKLKSEDRPRIIKAIAEAREHGDLKENAEYHAAREEQGFAEGRIQEIEGKLAGAQIIDVTTIPHTGKVVFGVTVHLVDVESDEEKTWRIVGDDEADLKAGKISVSSPVARALVGKSEGDVVTVQAPGGAVEYEIDRVEHL